MIEGQRTLSLPWLCGSSHLPLQRKVSPMYYIHVVCKTASRASRASPLSSVLLSKVFESHLLTMCPAGPLYLWCPLMSSEAPVSAFCRDPGLQLRLSESQRAEWAVLAFHIQAVVVRGFNSIFPVLAADTAAKVESSAYKYFLGLRISDFFVCVLIGCPFNFSFHTYWLI